METILVCSNKWCKSKFEFVVTDGCEYPSQCPKCSSFESELSTGITWVDKQFADDPETNVPMRFIHKITKFL